MSATCTCGRVQVTATGNPLVSTVCYCQDCRKGAKQIEALPNAATVQGPDGGTAYILWRKDRLECVKGAEYMRRYKLTDASATNRVVATCCNSAMFIDFDRGPHWISTYRARFHGELPPLQYRICVKAELPAEIVAEGIPSYRGYPSGLIVKLLASRLAMLLGR